MPSNPIRGGIETVKESSGRPIIELRVADLSVL
jgi:hypothetical protein